MVMSGRCVWWVCLIGGSDGCVAGVCGGCV